MSIGESLLSGSLALRHHFNHTWRLDTRYQCHIVHEGSNGSPGRSLRYTEGRGPRDPWHEGGCTTRSRTRDWCRWMSCRWASYWTCSTWTEVWSGGETPHQTEIQFQKWQTTVRIGKWIAHVVMRVLFWCLFPCCLATWVHKHQGNTLMTA